MSELVKETSDILRFRKAVQEFESRLLMTPGFTKGDSPDCPLKHTFSEGMYVREIFIPKGYCIVGKIHKHSHPNFLMVGSVVVITERGRETLHAPLSMISPAGTKRVVLALEDTVWVTVHLNLNEERDIDKIEEYVIAKSYDELPLLKEESCELITSVERGAL